MATPFSTDTWNQADFTFTIHDGTKVTDKLGRTRSLGKEVIVRFKVGKKGGSGMLSQEESLSKMRDIYSCKVTAVDGDLENPHLPKNLGVGDVGEGEIDGRPCRVIIKSVAQSSVKIVTQQLGDSVSLEVEQWITRGGGNV